ncbi:MAG: glycosyltransferase family 2 protein [Flavobacteriales bacterium]
MAPKSERSFEVADLKQNGRLGDALEAALRAFEKSPGAIDRIVEVSELLMAWHRNDEAEVILSKGMQLHPDECRIAEKWASLLVKTDRAEAAMLVMKNWHDSSPDQQKFHRNWIKLAIGIPDLDRARQLWQSFSVSMPEHVAFSTEIDLLVAENQFEEAYDKIALRLEKIPENEALRSRSLVVLSRLLLKEGKKKWGGRAQRALMNSLDSGADRNAAELNLALALGKRELSDTILKEIPFSDKNLRILLHRARRKQENGNVVMARLFWENQILKQHPFPQLRSPEPRELIPLNDMPPQDVEDIRLFTVIRNEKWRLPWFLDYYRKLGVDHFFFVDNGSTDGSPEWLLKAGSDVHVIHTDVSYAKGNSGLVWLNALMDAYGRKSWNLYLDVDEALVFPRMEELGLTGLTKYMEALDQEALAGQMVDMFSSTPVKLDVDGFERDFVTHYPLYESSYERTPIPHCPFYFTSGGVRRNLGYSENQTKVPLIRGGRGIHLLYSSHMITPAKLSDISCGLLHFKLAGDYVRQFQEDAQANNRVGTCKIRHQIYGNFFEQLQSDHVDFTNKTTRRYEGPKSLQAEGIVTTTYMYEAFDKAADSGLWPRQIQRPNLSFSHAGNFVWFRVAKTGTRTIDNILSELSEDYRYFYGNIENNIIEMQKTTASMLSREDVFVFTIVRNPFDRLVSAWQNKFVDRNSPLAKRFWKHLGVEKNSEIQLRLKTDFDFFVRTMLNSNLATNIHFCAQTDLLHGFPETGFVGRFERFEADLKVILLRLNRSHEEVLISKLNKSKRKSHYSSLYTPELIEMVRDFYKSDLDAFGYDFEDADSVA